METKNIRRGDIYWIDQAKNPRQAVGVNLQKGNRPAIIVSNDIGNRYAPVFEVVYLTAAPKKDLPTHAIIRSSPSVSTALCEHITTVGIEAIGEYVAHITDDEMQRVDACLMVSLGLQATIYHGAAYDEPETCEDSSEEEIAELRQQLHAAEMDKERLTASLNLLHMMYNDLLDKLSQ